MPDSSIEGSGVLRDRSAPTGMLLVAFAGLGRDLDAPPPFEFRFQAESLAVNRVFVRDTERSWYQRGVKGLGADIASTAEALRTEARAQQAQQVVYIGHSAGGYGALLFGHLARADRVIVFSPRTFLTPSLRRRYHDERFQERLDAVCEATPDPAFLDLLGVLRGNRPTIEVHFPRWHRLDRVHARHLRAVPGLSLHPHANIRHNFVRTLRDTGELGAILRDAVTSATPLSPQIDR